MNLANHFKPANVSSDVLREQSVIRQSLAEVILGRKSDNCRSFGICRIERVHPLKAFYYDSGSNCCEKIVYAIASLKERAFFELAFLRSTVNRITFEQHFENQVFTLREPYRVNEDLIGSTIDLIEGEYNITITDTLLLVRFDLIP